MEKLQAHPGVSAAAPAHAGNLSGSESCSGQKTYYPACRKPIAWLKRKPAEVFKCWMVMQENVTGQATVCFPTALWVSFFFPTGDRNESSCVSKALPPPRLVLAY